MPKNTIPLLTSARRLLREAAFFLLDIFYNAVIIIALVVLIRGFLISPFRVIGSSMADTLGGNEFILIDKLSYRLGEPKRGDPIVFRPPITESFPSKFETAITLDDNGQYSLDVSAVNSKKKVIYCQNPLMEKFWFCRESIRHGDLVFSLPIQTAQDKPESSAWKSALEREVSQEEAKIKSILFSGTPNRHYLIRIFDSKGPDYFVKRIIGIPGDTIRIENGRVYLKPKESDVFRVLQESYLNAENQNRTFFSQQTGIQKFEVPDQHYFVLGDNRNHSNDSRSWFAPIRQVYTPYVPLKNISGKVLLVLWPLTNIRVIPGALISATP